MTGGDDKLPKGLVTGGLAVADGDRLRRFLAEVPADDRIEVAATQTAVIEMFRRLGFEPEARLRDELCDATGELQDIVVLSHFVEDIWSTMLTAGTDVATD